MTTIQGVPDLGPGLRLHLNENTGGCSPKVVEAVRAFDGPALATYPDFRDAVLETAAFLGVDPDRIVLTNGLDEGILLASIAYLGHRTPEALVALGAPLTTHVGRGGSAGRAAGVRALHSRRARARRARRGGAARHGLRVSARRHAAARSRRTRASSTSTTRTTRAGSRSPKEAIRTASRGKPATRWSSSTRRITTFSARTFSRRRPTIRTCWSAARSRRRSASPACASA